MGAADTMAAVARVVAHTVDRAVAGVVGVDRIPRAAARVVAGVRAVAARVRPARVRAVRVPAVRAGAGATIDVGVMKRC